MNGKDHALFFKALSGALPDNYRSEEEDDFVNFDLPQSQDRHDRHGTSRVFRVVGPRRHLMRFVYDDDPFGGIRRYWTEFLLNGGSWTRFEAKRLMEEAAKKKVYSYERVVGGFLSDAGAVAFVGAGWATALANTIRLQIPSWERANATFLWVERDGVRSSLVSGADFCLCPRPGDRRCCILFPGHEQDHSDGRGYTWRSS